MLLLPSKLNIELAKFGKLKDIKKATQGGFKKNN